MAGAFIQGLTPEMAHHANQTAAYAETLGDNVRRSQANTMDLGGSMRGEAYQTNVAGHENWSQSASLKGQNQAGVQSDGMMQITNIYDQMSAGNVHSFGTVNMPTA
ncbi:hypothetical protein EV649_7777 [Kribbella sp. VKM Ac-2569]|uniref:hypothetical protein n=1 Tax=Kribbella sp. VKM Ac-2569 TaxID=2512220 RepID=UPI00102CCE36|nr:hypothetical protein [Kribbella sp. VKM Ac-2569]RZT07849.1 hypothetical protein EV649_7777 [Kribbella sp. VKM Ac-2569]